METHKETDGASAPEVLTMNPSERIKAALSRPEAARNTGPSATMQPGAAVETTLPLLGNATRAASSQATAVDSAAKIKTAPSDTPNSKLLPARLMYVGAGVLVLAVVAVVVIRQRAATVSKPNSAASLQVMVKPEGNGLLSIRWNPQSEPVARAREGRLVILETGQQPKVVQLQRDELKIGHVFYESSADRLEFRLEVVDEAGAVVKESVLALPSGTAVSAPKPGPFETIQSPAVKQQITTTDPKQDARQQTASVPATASAVTTPEVQPSQPAPRTFTPPPPTPLQQPTEEVRAVVLDPVASVPGGISAPARVNLPQMNVVPPPAPKAPVTQAQPANRQATNVGGGVQPAALLKKVAPVYPPMARTARIQGTVRFTATVDKNGNVQNIQFMSGPQMLVQAATEAVKKWVYRPMMLNGQPTEVITQIEVKFSIAP
jgi:periplasmic protein TonB